MNSMTDQKVTIIAPMFNEEANLRTTYESVKAELEKNSIRDYEIIFVNDGSTDQTWEKAKALAATVSNLSVIGYSKNQGRGKALRTGIDAATGDIIITIDFDLTYDVSHIGRMLETLNENEIIDAVLVSCYMPGGQVIGVQPKRLLVSKIANLLYQYAYSPKIYTSTCVVRAYRKHAIKNLTLTSDDKEIHLEILSKVLANGFKIKEIPGTLRRREEPKGKTVRKTFKFKAQSLAHIIYFIQEKPFYLFGVIGFTLFNLSILSSGVLLYSRFGNDPVFNETILAKIMSPNLVLLLLISGMQMMGIGFLGIQNNLLKREIFRNQRMMNEINNKIQKG